MIFSNIKKTSSVYKKLWIFMIFSLLMGISACKTQENSTASLKKNQSYYGDKIDSDNAQSLDVVIATLNTESEVEAKIKGTVASVCKKKGCWINVQSETGQEIFVKFKDYGFFMPLDCEGQEVIMRGKAYKEVTSVDELRHYAEDEGKSQEEINNITEEVIELKFLSDGVILLPKEK